MASAVIGDLPNSSIRKEYTVRVIVVPLVMDGQGRILLGKMPEDRGAYPGQWALPGGGMEEGETTEETAVREIREETGLTVTVGDAMPHAEAYRIKLKPGADPQKLHCLYLYFRATVIGGELTPNEEFEILRFFTISDAMKLDLNIATRQTLSRYFPLK